MALLHRMVLRNLRQRKFHTTPYNSLFWESPDKDGYAKKSKAEEEWEKMSLKDRLVTEAKLMKEGVSQWAQQLVGDALRGPSSGVPPHEVDVVWRFTGEPEELKKWVITTDKDHNLGFSTAQLDFTRNCTGLFHGFVDTKVPPDGQTKSSGFCNARLLPLLSPFKNKLHYDWDEYTHLVIRLRGDGRVYSINLHLEREDDVCMYDTYHYFIWTRGGPYWQHVRIPFSKFFFAYKGRIQVSNKPLPRDEIGTISFTLGDKITGPFRLEIDYIGVENDPSHIEESAYEQYAVEKDERYW